MKKKLLTILTVCILLAPVKSRADFWGGDVVVLTQILTNALQQLVMLKQIFTTGNDTLGLLEKINEGIRTGLDAIHILNPKFDPGVLGHMDDPRQVLGELERLYGTVPATSEAGLQKTQDQSAAESLAMNAKMFRYSEEVEIEQKRILEHAALVNPQGAAKLQNQSIAVLIGVTNELLRTNSEMLKLMAENLAMQNRKDKLSSRQFKQGYDGLSEDFDQLPTTLNLPTLKGN